MISYFRSDPILPENWNSVPRGEPASPPDGGQLIHLAMSAHRLSTLPSEVRSVTQGAHGGVPRWHARHIATSPHECRLADLDECSGALRMGEVQRCTLARSQLLPMKGRFSKTVRPGIARSGMHALHAAQTAASNE